MSKCRSHFDVKLQCGDERCIGNTRYYRADAPSANLGNRRRLPYNKERAQSLRGRIPIWRTICVASDTGADRAIQFAALHRETRARFLWGADATVDARH